MLFSHNLGLTIAVNTKTAGLGAKTDLNWDSVPLVKHKWGDMTLEHLM